MRDPSELTESEAELINRLIGAYPGALGYRADREPTVRLIAAQLLEEGRIERLEIEGDVAYRLTDEHADEVRRTAADRAVGSRWN